jgi:hypothetical protein
MRPAHPLLDAAVLAAIEHAASEHHGRRWVVLGFTDLDDRASHPCGILHGTPFSVFAKVGAAGARDELGAGVQDQFAAGLGAGARDQFAAELAGLRLLSRAARVPVPVPGSTGSRPGCRTWSARNPDPRSCTETPSSTTLSAPRPARS